jgi:hypothetical protein
MKKVDIIKWFATGLTLCGAVCTAFQVDPLNVYFLNAGALVFLIWACMIKEKAMITVNAGLLIIYIIGLVVRV